MSVMIGVAAPATAQQVRPYRPAFDVVDYVIAIDLPDTGSTIHGLSTGEGRGPTGVGQGQSGTTQQSRGGPAKG